MNLRRGSTTSPMRMPKSYLFAEFFYEFAARLDDVAHEDAEELVGFDGVLHLDAVDDAVLGVHRRLPELLGVHLAEPFVALDVDFFAVRLFLRLFHLFVGEAVGYLLAALHAVERRLRDVEILW